MELIRDNVKVEWESLGEGHCGDYNPEDPDDEKLLRFYVSVLRDGEWEEVEDGSHCTLFPESATDEEKRVGLSVLMHRFHKVLMDDPNASIKKLSEEMSWISLDTVQRVMAWEALDGQIQAAADDPPVAKGENRAVEMER